MKKVILSLAILVASSMSMFAATDNKTENKSATCTSQTTCNVNAKCGEKKDRSAKANKAFEGLNLTAEQQAKLAELRKNCTANKENCTANKENCDAKKGCDSKSNLTDEQKKQLKAESKAKHLEARKKYLEDVKTILTPEQYTKFLENNYLSASKKNGNRKMQGMKMAQKKHGKKGAGKNIAGKGERNNKNGKTNTTAKV